MCAYANAWEHCGERHQCGGECQVVTDSGHTRTYAENPCVIEIIQVWDLPTHTSDKYDSHKHK